MFMIVLIQLLEGLFLFLICTQTHFFHIASLVTYSYVETQHAEHFYDIPLVLSLENKKTNSENCKNKILK